MQPNGVCAIPFFSIEYTYWGQAYLCCPAYCREYSIGDIKQLTLEDLWHGEKAEYFRQRLLEGDYSLCDLDRCAMGYFVTREFIQDNYYRNGKLLLPKTVSISYDRECNLACNTCRKKVIKNDARELERCQSFEKSFYKHLENCEAIRLLGSGDPFASRYTSDLMRRIVCDYPKIQFHLLTNGQLFTPAKYFELNLDNKIRSLTLSIHAASREAYRKVTRSNAFERVLRNLGFIKELKDEGMIPSLSLTFVVCAENYRDMPAFAEMGQKHGAICNFNCYNSWVNDPFSKNFAAHAVYLEGHPEHQNLLQVLGHANLKHSSCRLDGILRTLQENQVNGHEYASSGRA